MVDHVVNGTPGRPVLQLERSPFEPAVLLRLGLLGLGLVGLGLLLSIPVEGDPPAFDAALSEGLTAPMDSTTFAVVQTIGRIGHLTVMTVVAVALAVYARRRSGTWHLALLLATVLGGATVMTGILKVIIDRARPEDTLTLSAAFPSGHTVRGVAVLGLVGWCVRAWSRRAWVRELAIPVAVVLVVVNGLARVVLGVHWPTDVLAGFLLGGAWLVGSCALLKPHAVARAPVAAT